MITNSKSYCVTGQIRISTSHGLVLFLLFIDMYNLLENQLIYKAIQGLARSPIQLNKPFCSDSEILNIDGRILACTSDTICEEIESGLYEDPKMMGRICVSANMSDLAAVGATPLGVLLHFTYARDSTHEFIQSIMKGVKQACNDYGTYVLGGDTNFGSSTQLGVTALGVIDSQDILSRQGCKPGDLIFTTNLFGEGNAFAADKLLLDNSSQIDYSPTINIEAGQLIKQFASACIDTSDGFLSACANLMEVNSYGFEVTTDVNHLLVPSVVEFANDNGMPPWLFLAGPHGEYNLLFTVPFTSSSEFVEAAKEVGIRPIQIGNVIAHPLLTMTQDGESHKVDPFRLTNIFHESGSDLEAYITTLLKTGFYA